MAIKSYSTTPASNNSASPNGFPEGMAPSGVNDSARQVMADIRSWYDDVEWRDWGHTVTRTGNTTFTIPTDVTAIYVVNRPIRCTDSSTLYGYISAVSYGAPNTTVTVTLDSGNLSASLASVALGVDPSKKSIDSASVRNAASTVTPHTLQNAGLTASVSAKALTIALKGQNLNDPSASNPVQIAFRNATLTTGDYVVRSVTAATSVVVPSGGTLGFTAAEDGLIYIYAIDNAGTVELAVAKKALFDESIVHSTTAISVTADSDNVLYSTTARTGVAVRLIGRIRITTGAVAGEWDNEDTRIETWTPSMKKTGDTVQTVYAQTSAAVSSAVVIPLDNTIPQITEGAEAVGSLAMAATSTINSVEIESHVQVSAGANQSVVSAVFDGATDAKAANFVTVPANLYGINSYNLVRYKVGSTASKTYSLRFGPNTAATVYANATGATGVFNGTSIAYLKVTEIQA